VLFICAGLIAANANRLHAFTVLLGCFGIALQLLALP
jgi:hypothetical protein